MNERQKWFCRHYLDTSVGSEAARLAGYKAKCPANYAYRLLQQANIQSRLMMLMKENERELELTCQRGFQKLFTELKTTDDFYMKNNTYKKIKSLINFMEEL